MRVCVCVGVGGGSRVALLEVRVCTLASSWGKMRLIILAELRICRCQEGIWGLEGSERLTRRGEGGSCSWLMMLVL